MRSTITSPSKAPSNPTAPKASRPTTSAITEPARSVSAGLSGTISLAACILAAAIFWHPGMMHLIGVWLSSPTYHHGFLVVPVSVLLILDGWRGDENLAVWPPALFGVGTAGALYGTGRATDIAIVQHGGIALLLPALLVLAAGPSFAVRHRFALLFFLLMVPFGEELVPILQEITAAGIMAALDILGILSVRDGLMIRTEAGDFRVAEACAGLRFLVAMIVSGVLFAHLLFTSFPRQTGFLILCIVVPIVANVLRAAATVVIASRTDMAVAAGFDHIVYGWVFFAVIFAVILGTGLRMAQASAPSRPAPPIAEDRHFRLWPFAAAIGMIVAMGGI